ncbi:phosphotransferase family protein [Mycolicibacterium frederiksbergense]|jgi:aminoglycoside phosphotransferase (APT) family kinase protein|uniref:phosphotransferase family protein n=1 Tax=Mycolicibacterium frederiksbergense TaxID=117567 RepID=UPI00265B9897|nr:aminoglycoside phosphotransferase family protein [Mycolicibacterium frederiksbergense]MBX9919641.1 aminoglycoside phosphotransferase family protein [Mycolicibacterium frederiksbergense]MDO0976722.1 aminoglycoside phosphotransferase family protein [Mycolicibacterium frederiksbergense]
MTDPIPGSPEDVTPAWLGGVLGADVRSVEIAPIGTGQTGATYRLTVQYGTETDLPGSFAIKLPSQDDTVRDRVAIGYRSEHAFYRDVADLVQVPIPRNFHCEIGSEGAEFVLLLADMAPAEQGDQIAGCSADEAQLAVRALAGLHAPSWCDPKLTDFPGIAMPKPDAAMASGMGDVAKMATDITLEKLGDRMTAEDRATLAASMAVVTPWLLTEPDRFALLHGDYRLDNMLFDPDRTRITVVDWQTLGSGLPARDLAYFTATSLDPVTRAAAERDLVADYHAGLVALGVTGYDEQTCWRDYRLGMLQAPLIIVFGVAFANATERGDEMMLVMAERSCRAIRELDTLALI